MPDRWQTFPFEFKGGLISNLSPYQQGVQAPGSARILVNYEPSVFGGYRRIEGYDKFDSNALSNTGNVRGLIEYANQVYAARGDDLYRSSGSGWTQVTDNSTFSSAGVNLGGTGRVRFLKYNFDGTEKLFVVDGTGKPFRFTGSAFAQLSSLPSDTSGATHAVNFKNHIFLANGENVVFSAPYEDDDFTAASGGGIINVADNVTDLIVFRDQLIIFGETTIHRLAGTSQADFQLQPVSRDLGAVASDTVQEIGGDIIFLGPDGLRLFSATDKIGDFSLASVSKPIQAEMIDLVANSASFASTVVREKSQYRIFGFRSASTNDASRGIAATQLEGDIAFNELRGFKAFCVTSQYTGSTENIYFAGSDGYVYQMEQGNTLDGTNIVATFATPFVPLSDPNLRKTVYKGITYVDVNGVLDLKFSLKYDFDQPDTVQPEGTTLSNDASTVITYGSGTFGTSTFGSKPKTVFDVQTVGSGNSVSLVYETTGTTTDAVFTVDAATLEYATYGRR